METKSRASETSELNMNSFWSQALEEKNQPNVEEKQIKLKSKKLN